jgi:hypothetical protein
MMWGAVHDAIPERDFVTERLVVMVIPILLAPRQ